MITDDPLKFKFGDVNFRVDLGAEKIIAAEKAGSRGDNDMKTEAGQAFQIIRAKKTKSKISIFHIRSGRPNPINSFVTVTSV